MTPIRVDAATVEPVSVPELRGYLRLDPDDGGVEDALLASLAAAARGQVEARTRRLLAPGRYRVMLTAWPADGRVPVPLSPLVALERASLVDADGVVTDLPPGLIRLGPDRVEAPCLLIEGAPSLLRRAALIEVSAGYGGDGPAPPAPLLQAIRLLAAHAYEHRGDAPGAGVPPPAAAALLDPFRWMRL